MDLSKKLPSTWAWSKVNEIAFVNPKNNYFNVRSDLPVTFVPMAAVDEVTGSIVTSEILSFEDAKKGHTKFLENDIIFARITPCMENGKIAMARNLKNGLGFGSTEFHVLRPKNGIIPEYVYYYVRQKKFRNFAAGFMTSTVGQLRVPKDVIEDAEIPLAPTNEQKRIVSKIEELFKESKYARKALDKIPSMMKRFRQSVLASAFRGELIRQDPNDEPAEKLLERIMQERRIKWEADLKSKGKNPEKFKYEEPESIETDELSELPNGWSWVSIEQVCTVSSGGTPRRSIPEYWDGDIPWVSSGEVAFCEITKTKEHITELGLKNSSAKIFPIGTVLLALYGEGKTRGQTAILRIPASTNQAVAAVLSDYVLSKYVYWWLIHRYYENRKIGSGANQSNMYLSQVRTMALPLSPLDEQKKIVHKIEELLSFADQIEKSVAIAKQRVDKVDQSILAKAFKGELVPQDPNDEPAEKLLERIKSQEIEVKSKNKKKKSIKH